MATKSKKPAAKRPNYKGMKKKTDILKEKASEHEQRGNAKAAKMVRDGINPATKQPHSESFLR